MNILLVLLAVAALAGVGYWKSRYIVPTGYVGLVYRKLPPLQGHHPQDVFTVRTYNSQGFQARTLEADRPYLLPRLMYRVTNIPRTTVPTGSFGVVVAKLGAQPPGDRVLCDKVECRNFQDGEAFLRGGGQMGRQPDILLGGTYAINPMIFEVLTVDTIGDGSHNLTAPDLQELSIQAGSTGVVITLDGITPDEEDSVGPRVPGHQNFLYPSEFLNSGGHKGVQEETLSRGGVYRINPWFARVRVIPTRDLILEWSNKEQKQPTRYDAALDQFVVNIEGQHVRIGMTQVIRIPARAAPHLVGRFGEGDGDTFGASGADDHTVVQRFVERVIGSTVEGYFRAAAAKYTYTEFVIHYDEVRLDLQAQLREALADWGVEAVRTTLSEFRADDSGIDTVRRLTAEERQLAGRLQAQQANAHVKASIDKIGLKVERERRKLETVTLEEQIRLLGGNHVAMERIIERLANAPVPQVIAGGEVSDVLRQMPLYHAQELLDYAFGRTAGDIAPTKVEQIESPQPADAPPAQDSVNDAEGE